MGKESNNIKINRTRDYSRFKRLEGNRDVSEARIRKIVKSIERVGYVMSPICVNENNEVIDGQGRLEALKRLGLPVDYYVVKGIGIDECISLNIYQSNWTMIDYINSYAETGINSYIYLQQLIKQYKGMSLKIICYAVSGKSEVPKAIKNGTFHCTSTDYDSAIEMLNFEKKFSKCLSGLRGHNEFYYMGLGFCYGLDEVDNARLLTKMEQLKLELSPVSTMEQALGEIERVYNNRSRNKVYLYTEYRKAMDRKYKWYKGKYMKDEIDYWPSF